MAAIVYRGLQSFLDSPLVESKSIHLKFPSSKPINSTQPVDQALKTCFLDSNPNTKPQHQEITYKTDNSSNNLYTGGWSFLQTLSDISQIAKEASEKETTYVHPQTKRCSLHLSQKSLELCTENLGNETGTDIIADNNVGLVSDSSSASIDCVGEDFPTTEQVRPHQLFEVNNKKVTKIRDFPPPLTTIRESGSFRVRPRREEGRLLIEAVKVSSSSSCFQAQRSHGRLRLSFSRSSSPCSETQEDESEENELNNGDFNGEEEEIESDSMKQKQEVEEDDDDKEEEEEQEDVEHGDKDMNENNWSVGGENRRMGKYQGRRTRCNEGGGHESKSNELLSWESLWVATS